MSDPSTMFSVRFIGRLLAVVVLLLCSSVTYIVAQKTKGPDPGPVVKFGAVMRDQFARMPTDSTAEAVVLYDQGDVFFNENDGDIWMHFTHHVRIRINRKSAYKRATIQLPLYRNTLGKQEYVSDFEGASYNLDNGNLTVDQLGKTGHFTEKVSDTYFLEKYALPNVHEGTIIEYRYVVHTPFSVMHSPRTWQFQQDVPVNWSEYRITIPDYFYYKILRTGYLDLTVNERTSTTVDLFPGQNGAPASAYRFAMKDIPAFRDEPYITTDDDYMAKLEFELASYRMRNLQKHDLSVSWLDLERTLLNDSRFGGQIKRTGFLRETAQTLLAQKPDTLGRVTAAYEFVRKAVKWNKEARLFASEDIKKTFENKKGNAADINLMLVALLREMDFNANPVILSTRSHGRISEEHPLIRKFNYVVAQVSVGGKDLLLDATDPYLTPGMLPTYCLNGTGRLIQANHSRFVSLIPSEREADVTSAMLTISDDGEISGTMKQSRGGYSAWQARQQFATDGKTKYLEKMQKKRTMWQIEKADFSGAEWQNSSFDEIYTLTIPEACGRAGNRLYLRPTITEGIGQNPFKEANRIYPVDFAFAKEMTFTATYTLPPGFQVEEMPKPTSMSLPDKGGRFDYQVSVTNNQLQVVSRLLLRKPNYSAGEYASIRELFSRIITKQAEPVVLRRGAVAENK